MATSLTDQEIDELKDKYDTSEKLKHHPKYEQTQCAKDVGRLLATTAYLNA